MERAARSTSRLRFTDSCSTGSVGRAVSNATFHPRVIQLMRDAKRNGFVVRVEQQQEIRVFGALSRAVANLRRQCRS